MAAKPHYPTRYLAQLAEPFRASGACKFGKETDIGDTASFRGGRAVTRSDRVGT